MYVSEKDIQDLGGAQGVEFRNMRSGEKEELKVGINLGIELVSTTL